MHAVAIDRSGRCSPSPLPTHSTSGFDEATAKTLIDPVGWSTTIGIHTRQ